MCLEGVNKHLTKFSSDKLKGYQQVLAVKIKSWSSECRRQFKSRTEFSEPKLLKSIDLKSTDDKSKWNEKSNCTKICNKLNSVNQIFYVSPSFVLIKISLKTFDKYKDYNYPLQQDLPTTLLKLFIHNLTHL